MSDAPARHAIRSPVASWRSQANCLSADPSLFFNERGRNHEVRQTINEWCVPCPVKAECLAEGLKETTGIWGGTTHKERRRLRVEAQHNIRLMKPSD